MSYAPERVVHDADSHIMELPDWIERYADPGVRERLRPLALGGAGKLAEAAVAEASARRDDSERADAAEAALMNSKGWSGLGAFDATERSRAMDLLGFDSQLVFSTFAGNQFLGDDLELSQGGLTAHNRAVTDFCADDRRLLPVAMAAWNGPEHTLATVIEALDLGASAILFPSHPGSGISPTHPDYDVVWSTLEERRIPFMLHIGGAGRPVKKAFHDNGRPTTDFLGGGENVRSRDYMAIHQVPEQFLSAMILDGVLDDHPDLRGGSIEQGALWLPGFLRLIDACQATFSKTEPRVKELTERASDYVHRQVFVTPFVREDVGWLIESCGDDTLLFSSDFPHPEGSKDPVRHFEATMDDVSDTARDRFYEHNFAEMMGAGLR
ncbi:MAG: amidohydrolase family protein [Acidimicrobiales bacterium]|nr:amidohydrolase family protein [Acidimicrobiales bacterium]